MLKKIFKPIRELRVSRFPRPRRSRLSKPAHRVSSSISWDEAHQNCVKKFQASPGFQVVDWPGSFGDGS
jgi:hypothetical protein